MARTSSDERRAQILAASGRLVRRRGFTTTRMSDVASELGLSAPLIVYHFGTKDELMAATLAAEAHAELVRLDAVVRSGLDPLTKLRQIVDMSLGPASVADWALWIDAWGEALRSPVMAHHLDELDRRWRRSLERVVAAGVEEGAFEAVEIRVAGARLMALLDGYGVCLVRARSDRSRGRVLASARSAVGAVLGISLPARRAGGVAVTPPARGRTPPPCRRQAPVERSGCTG